MSTCDDCVKLTIKVHIYIGTLDIFLFKRSRSKQNTFGFAELASSLRLSGRNRSDKTAFAHLSFS